MINLSQEQLDFLQKYNFHYIEKEDPHKTSFPYVWGPAGRNSPEFYNMETIEKLINELKTHGKLLEDKDSIQYIADPNTEYYEVSFDSIRFLEKRIDRKTKELEIENVIRKGYSPRKRLIYEETEDYVDVVHRYTGDMGDGSQFLKRIYKNKKAAIKVSIKSLEIHKEKHLQRIALYDELIQKYTKEIS